jgi:hypothetical protein
VAKEIWLCDKRTVTKYLGEIDDFKMQLRRQLESDNLIEGGGKPQQVMQVGLRCARVRVCNSLHTFVSLGRRGAYHSLVQLLWL